MPPTSKKLRGHIGLGLSVCLLRLLVVVKLENRLSQELEILYIASVQKISEHVFFFGPPSYSKVMPLFRLGHKKPCQYDNLRTAKARILIFGIWPGINV